MIEGLIQIGSALPSDDGSLSNLIQVVEPIRKNKQLNVLKINFDLDNDRLIFDVNEEMDINTSKKYNYIGSASGPNSPQWYVTSTMINYHITETIFNLSNQDFSEELNKKIKAVLEQFYYLVEESMPNKYKYALNIEKFNISNIDMRNIYEQVKLEKTKDGAKPKAGDIGKGIIAKLSKEIENYLIDNYDMKLSDFGLFTILINGEIIAQNKEYIDRVVESTEPSIKVSKTDKGTCSICASREDVTMDMTKTKIKLYTTNQIIFANNLDKNNYYKNMQMCKSCMTKYLAGENYLQNRLAVKLSTFDVYIIPQFVHGEPLNSVELDRVTDKIVYSFNTVKSFEGIGEMRNEIYNKIAFSNSNSYFLLNFLFYKSVQASTKVQAFIKDVNPSIFEKMAEATLKSNKDMRKAIGSSLKTYIDLQSVYIMNPIRLSKGSPTQYRSILQTYDSILTGKKLNKRNVIKNIVECTKIIWFNKESYNINPEKTSLEFYIIRSNMYLKFLEYMGCLKGGEGMSVEGLRVKDELKNYIESMSYTEEQAAMFLLGCLIGEIGNVQYKRNPIDGNKPILNKLNFNGIDKNKIIRLTKDVFNKLNQEKIRHFNETTFFEMKRLLDKNLESWSLNKEDNLFYILSGYSFVTTIPMLKEDN
jgi:CRISPR-associated protein Csh1